MINQLSSFKFAMTAELKKLRRTSQLQTSPTIIHLAYYLSSLWLKAYIVNFGNHGNLSVGYAQNA